jgi:hypothetical protein
MFTYKDVYGAINRHMKEWLGGRDYVEWKLNSDKEILEFITKTEFCVPLYELFTGDDAEEELYQAYGDNYDMVAVGMIDIAVIDYLREHFNHWVEEHNTAQAEYEAERRDPLGYRGISKSNFYGV